ncbi:MAG: hypothetical protein ACI9R3_005750 [Verrucomicrobiales bacterium]|jgi:hypothetical protein
MRRCPTIPACRRSFLPIGNLVTPAVAAWRLRLRSLLRLSRGDWLNVRVLGWHAVIACLLLPSSFALEPFAANPWYWSHDEKPLLLLGGSDDDNLFQWSEGELIAQLDRIQTAGGNVVRNTMSDRKDKGFEVYPFLQLEGGKYDLAKWNPEYWKRFERFLKETAKRGIFVQIEIWDRFDYTDNRDNDARRWQDHPYAPKNNVNYSAEESTFAARYPDHPGANKQPFFFTTPKQRDIAVVRRYQDAFVDKLLDHALAYDHVLYCIDNETKAEPAWGEYWARFIKARAKKSGVKVMVTEMWDAWNLASDEHKRTFDHPELYDFVDVSQNNHNNGDNHWDNFLYVRKYLAGKPRPMNTTKTYGADDNKFGHSDQDAIERFWRHLLAGAASARFHRPDSGLGINDNAVACIRAARLLEKHIPLWSVEPANLLLGDRGKNEAYLAASAKRDAYALFFPASKAAAEITLDLSDAQGEFTLHWLDIDTGKPSGTAKIDSGGAVKLSPPGKGNYAAAIIR